MNQVYVKVDKYHEVIDLLAAIHAKLEEAKASLNEITDLKAQEDAQLTSWQNELSGFEEKFTFVSSALQKTEGL